MKNVNSVYLLGYLGIDPVFKELKAGNSLCTLKLATSSSYKKDDEWKQKTQWHNISCWGALADKVHDWALTKGMPVMITGRIEYREYEDKEGNTKYITEIIANDIINLTTKEKDYEEKSKTKPKTKTKQIEYEEPNITYEESDDDMPF
jgi:single-strand DNA-binding protein